MLSITKANQLLQIVRQQFTDISNDQKANNFDKLNCMDCEKIHECSKKVLNNTKLLKLIELLDPYFKLILSAYMIYEDFKPTVIEIENKFLFYNKNPNKISRYWIDYSNYCKQYINEQIEQNEYFYSDIFLGLIGIYIKSIENDIRIDNKKQFFYLWENKLGIINIDKFTSLRATMIDQLDSEYRGITVKDLGENIIGWNKFIRPSNIQQILWFCILFLKKKSHDIPLNIILLHEKYCKICDNTIVNIEEFRKIFGIFLSVIYFKNVEIEDVKNDLKSFLKYRKAEILKKMIFINTRHYPNFFFSKILKDSIEILENNIEIKNLCDLDAIEDYPHLVDKCDYLYGLEMVHLMYYIYPILLVHSFSNGNSEINISSRNEKWLNKFLYDIKYKTHNEEITEFVKETMNLKMEICFDQLEVYNWGNNGLNFAFYEKQLNFENIKREVFGNVEIPIHRKGVLVDFSIFSKEKIQGKILFSFAVIFYEANLVKKVFFFYFMIYDVRIKIKFDNLESHSDAIKIQKTRIKKICSDIGVFLNEDSDIECENIIQIFREEFKNDELIEYTNYKCTIILIWMVSIILQCSQSETKRLEKLFLKELPKTKISLKRLSMLWDLKCYEDFIENMNEKNKIKNIKNS